MDSVALVCREQFGIDHPDLERDIVATWDGLAVHAGSRIGEVFAAALTGAQMRRIGLYPGAAEITHELGDLGYRVLIITHRQPETSEEVVAACDALGIRADEYFIGWADKVAYCQEQRVRVLVDDKPSTIADCVAAGLPVLTLGHPYNEQVCATGGVEPAGDWVELRHQLLDLLGEPAPLLSPTGP